MTQPIRNFEYQKEKARKIKKRVNRLQDSIKELEKITIENTNLLGGEEYLNRQYEDFNNELYDLAFELHNMEVVIEGKLEI